MSRKEYNDRWTKPLVNPGFTHGEYMAEKAERDAREKPETCACGAKDNESHGEFTESCIPF